MANSNIEMKSILYTIYPNPSNGDFNLNVSGLDYGLVKVTISNIIGKQVFETEVEASNGYLSKELHVNYLSNGIYFVKINSGKKEHIKKIVINN